MPQLSLRAVLDGLVFDAVEFLGRLAVLVPRPRINLVLYHGVLGPRAAWRAAVVAREVAVAGGGRDSNRGPHPVSVVRGRWTRIRRMRVSGAHVAGSGRTSCAGPSGSTS